MPSNHVIFVVVVVVLGGAAGLWLPGSLGSVPSTGETDALILGIVTQNCDFSSGEVSSQSADADALDKLR